MRSYTVHEPPNPPTDRLRRADRLVFVREGFSWLAALFTPLWMLVHGMWLVLIIYLVAVVALGAALVAVGAEPQVIVLTILALQIALGFEMGALRRWTLERKGWRMLGAVAGRNRIECERRFFQAWLGEKLDAEGEVHLSRPASPPAGPAAPGPAIPDGAVGSQA